MAGTVLASDPAHQNGAATGRRRRTGHSGRSARLPVSLRHTSSGDDIGQQLIFQSTDQVLQRQFALFHTLHLDLVVVDRGDHRGQRIVEIPMFLAQGQKPFADFVLVEFDFVQCPSPIVGARRRARGARFNRHGRSLAQFRRLAGVCRPFPRGGVYIVPALAGQGCAGVDFNVDYVQKTEGERYDRTAGNRAAGTAPSSP